MKKYGKKETEEKMDLLETKEDNNNIYKLQKRTNGEDEDEDEYEKYRVEEIDFISQSSNDDIETKMKKMIEIKRKGGNIQDYFHKKEQNKLEKMKMVADNFQQKKEKKQQQKKEEKLMKLKKGLEKCIIIIPKIMRNISYKKLIKQLKNKTNIKAGCEIINSFYTIQKRNYKKKYFDIFLQYSNENKMKRKIDQLKKDKKEKERKEKEEKEKKEKAKKEGEEKSKKEEKKEKKEKEKNEQKEEEKVKEEKHELIKDDAKNIKQEDSKMKKGGKKKSNAKVRIITPSSSVKIEDNKANDTVDNPNNKNNKMPILNEKGKKITSKKEKLENLKKRKENYSQNVNLQSIRKFEEIKEIDKQLDKQRKKFNKIKEGLNVSDTESSISFDLIPGKESIEKGLKILTNIFQKSFFINLLKYYKRSEKRRKTKRIDTYSSQKKVLPAEKISKKNIIVDMHKFQSEKGLFKIGSQFDQTKKIEKEKTKKGVKEIEEERTSSYFDDETEKTETFIQLNKSRNTLIEVDKSQLVEYDLFYKEQFFKNDVFKYDVNNIQDKEVQEINHEMNKLEAKRNLIAKKKEKDAQASKGLDTTEIELELEDLQKKYIKAKTIEKPKLDLVMNNTEGLLYKGRLLGCYFNGTNKGDFPRFALESEKEIGAREVIDFKVLRKEEQARRFFDYCYCMEERKKINKWFVYMRFWCRFFVDNWIFDNLSLLVIILNTVLILISDPTDSNNIGNTSDQYFLYFYTVEAFLKIISFKFFSAEDAYIKDYWNILDFFVVLVGWISFLIEKVMNGRLDIIFN